MNAHQPMSNGDAAWLHMDRPTNLMVITSVMWFDEPLDAGRLRGVIEERLVGRFVRFRQRAVESPLPLRVRTGRTTPTSTSTATSTTVAWRPRAARRSSPSSCRDLMSTPLDRSKPLWDLYLSTTSGAARP